MKDKSNTEAAPAVDRAFLNIIATHRGGNIITEVSAAMKQVTAAVQLTGKGGMAVFQGADAYEIPARLKTRVDDRRLVLFYETIALHKIVRESILLLVKQIADKTDIIPLLGAATTAGALARPPT